MRKQMKHGLAAVSMTALMACGGSDKQAQVQEPSAADMPPPPPAPTVPAPPVPESKPATMDPKPIDTELGGGTGAGMDTSAQTTAPAKPADKQLTDAQIVTVTSTANTGEIEMGELAKKSATTPDVKNYAAMMITQHRDLETKGKTLVTKVKITPAESDQSTALKNEVNTTITELKTQKGKDFDKAYIESQVRTHREVLDLIDNKLLPNAQNGELKTQLTDARSHVASHLAKAQELQAKLEATPATPAKKAPKGKTTTPPADQKPPTPVQ
jgi:putative membrane protein